jgi:hypothetical protein
MKVFFLILCWAMAFNAFSADAAKRTPASERAQGVIVESVPTWTATTRIVDTVNNVVCFEKETSISCVKVDKAKTK